MAKYKLFIVDDEQYFRDGLRECVDWSKYDIELAGEADNGVNALEQIANVRPDIVITDVRMPVMNGIRLSAELVRQYKNLKIIFISGYDEFEYLKSAINVEAADYILKPVNLDELNAVLEKVTHKIECDINQKHLIYQMKSKLIESMPLLRQKFFMSLIRGYFLRSGNITSKLEFLELKLNENSEFCVIVLSIDDVAELFKNSDEFERELTAFCIMNICQELIEIHFPGYIFENRQGEFVCLLQMEKSDDVNKLFSLIGQIQDNLDKHLKLNLTIGVGNKVKKLINIPVSYETAFEAASQKLFLGKSKVIVADRIRTFDDVIPVISMNDWQRIQLSIKTADVDSTLEFIDEIFTKLSSSRSIDLKYCHNVCLQLLIFTSNILMDLEIINEDSRMDLKNTWEPVFTLETIEDMRNYVVSYLNRASTLISEKRIKRSSNVVEKVKDIIHRNYDKNLTINDISQEVFLTSTYLCMVFKQETGDTLNEYLTKVRIEKAKELLLDHNNKLSDICMAVGYIDASYFTKVFKRYTGSTPSEFRDKFIK